MSLYWLLFVIRTIWVFADEAVVNLQVFEGLKRIIKKHIVHRQISRCKNHFHIHALGRCFYSKWLALLSKFTFYSFLDGNDSLKELLIIWISILKWRSWWPNSNDSSVTKAIWRNYYPKPYQNLKSLQ